MFIKGDPTSITSTFIYVVNVMTLSNLQKVLAVIHCLLKNC